MGGLTYVGNDGPTSEENIVQDYLRKVDVDRYPTLFEEVDGGVRVLDQDLRSKP